MILDTRTPVIFKAGKPNKNDPGERAYAVHCETPVIERQGGNEMKIEDRVEASGGNLDWNIGTGNVDAIIYQIGVGVPDLRKGGGTKAMKCRKAIFSCKPTKDPVKRAQQSKDLQLLKDAFLKRYGNPKHFYWVHSDREHMHIHILYANWNPEKQRYINMSQRELTYLTSMRWLNGTGLETVFMAGAFTRKEALPKAGYTKAKNAVALVNVLKGNPEQNLGALLLSGEAKLCVTNPRWNAKAKKFVGGGNPAISYRGSTPIAVANINFLLAKDEQRIGLDRKYRACRITPLSERSEETVQQVKFDAALWPNKIGLKEFDAFCDLVDPTLFCRTEEELGWYQLYARTGEIKSPRHAAIMKRLCQLAIMRRALGATEPLKHEPKWAYLPRHQMPSTGYSLMEDLIQSMIDGIPSRKTKDGDYMSHWLADLLQLLFVALFGIRPGGGGGMQI